MVRFIDHGNVPAGSQSLVLQFGPLLKQFEAAQDQLLCVKGVFLVHLINTVCIEQGKAQGKAAQHFHQPLV